MFEALAPLLLLLVAGCDINDHSIGYPTLQQTHGMPRGILGVKPLVKPGKPGHAAGFPKIELYRPTIGRAPLYPGDRNIVAIAADAPSRVSSALTVLNINDAGQVADFIRAKKDRPAFDHGDRGTGVRNRTALMFLQTLPDRRPR